MRTIWTRIALVVALAVVAPGTRAEEEPAASLRIVGSGYTMPRFTRGWAEAFERAHDVRVEIVSTGTSTAPPALLSGEADVGSMTRPLNDAEREAFERRHDRQPVAIPVAADALVVFVNGSNPLEGLSLSQIDAVFSQTRRCGHDEDVTTWGQLGLAGDWSDRAIGLYGRRPGSGTGTYFRDVALCGGRFKDWLRINPGGASAALAVAESRFAIGFGSRSDAIEGMKPLGLAANGAGTFARPTADGVASGSYPLGRLLYFYVLAPADGAPLRSELRAFLEYALSEEAQAAVEKAGFLRAPQSAAAALSELLGSD